jgi:hypothetical protein
MAADTEIAGVVRGAMASFVRGINAIKVAKASR